MFAALSIFRGGWTIATAESVCGANIDVLESLADKSLVRRWETNRFGMPETIREFAAERLAPADRDELSRGLLEHLLELARAAGLYEEAGGRQRPELIVPERANVEVALGWALDAGEIELGMRLIWLLELHLATGDPLAARTWIDAFVSRAGDGLDAGLRARATRVRGATFDMTGESGLAEREYVRARELFLEAGDSDAAAHLLNRIAMSALQQDDVERAARLGAEALELNRERGHRRDQAIALSLLGYVALERGDRDEGVRLLYESAALAEEVGFLWWRGVTLGNLAESLLEAGELDEAERALISAAEAIAMIDDRVNTFAMLATAAWAAAARGDGFRAGMFWGAIEAAEERQPTSAWTKQGELFRARVTVVAGDEFERGRAHGRTLMPEEALDAVRPPLD